MNILLGCNHLHEVGGSEQHLFSLAKGFKSLGHEVFVILGNPTLKGIMSERLEKELGIVVDEIRKNTFFDAVFLSHTTTVKRFFDEVVNIKELTFNNQNIFQICHGVFHDIEKPLNIAGLRYVAISEEVQLNCIKHLKKNAVVSVVRNPIDLSYFYPTIISEAPKNLLSLSQNDNFNATLKRACNHLSLSFNKRNKHTNPILDLRPEIANADIVVSLGRGVYESMAMCKSVIIADSREYMKDGLMDGMINDYKDFFHFVENNCSGRYSKKQVSTKHIIAEIEKYHPSQCQSNRQVIDRFFSHKKIAQDLLNLLF